MILAFSAPCCTAQSLASRSVSAFNTCRVEGDCGLVQPRIEGIRPPNDYDVSDAAARGSGEKTSVYCCPRVEWLFTSIRDSDLLDDVPLVIKYLPNLTFAVQVNSRQTIKVQL